MYFKICIIGFVVLASCQNEKEEKIRTFVKYYEASKGSDREAIWEYAAETVRVWFESKENEPSLRYQGKPKSKWGEWDEVMNATSNYDSIWFNYE